MAGSKLFEMNRRAVLAVLTGLASGSARALYDPKPDEGLSAVQGEWVGALTYRDYGAPDRLVTLPARLYVALGAPNELVMHYVFDDGPSKAVFSYERMGFDFAGGQVTWTSGISKPSVSVYGITSDTAVGLGRRLSFERRQNTEIERYGMALSARALALTLEEVHADGQVVFRNKYEFLRAGA